MSSDLLGSLIAEIGKALAPLGDAIVEPEALEMLLAQVGLEAQAAGGDSLAAALGAIVTLADDIEQLAAAPEPSFAGITAVLEAARQVVAALRALSGAGGLAAEFESFGTDLIDVLVAQYLWNWHPLAHELAILATLIEPADEVGAHPGVVQDGTVVRQPFAVERVRVSQLSPLIKDPWAVLRAEYGNPLATVADANAMADKLFPRLLAVLRTLGVACRYGFDPADAALLGDAAPFVDHALIIYTDDELAGAEAEAGVIVTISSADRGDLGFVFTPFGTLTLTRQSGNLAVELDLTVSVPALAVGRHGATLLSVADTAELDGTLTATLAAPAPATGTGTGISTGTGTSTGTGDGTLTGTGTAAGTSTGTGTTPTTAPAFLVGSPTGSRLEVGGAKLTLQTTLSEQKQTLSIAATVTQASIVIAAGDGDSFLHSVLPPDGLRTTFDLGIAWSNNTGLSFTGSAGLHATLPAGISFGGVVKIPSVYLGLDAAEAGAQAEISLTAALAIGPVHVVVDRFGVTGSLTSPDGGGNLGPAELGFAFKPPSGAGLVIDAAAVTGGGYLSFDPQQSEYAGALDLSACGIALKAYGLVQTRLPGGAPGYSFIAVVSTEFSPPVQLPFGFTLNGVGGLLGLKRAVDEDAVQKALWAHQLDGLLFPQDPVTSAPQLIAKLDAYFPAAPGRFLVGLLARIAWGEGIVVGDAALVAELPEPLKLLIMGDVSVTVPPPHPLLILHISFAGGVDFGQQLAFFDATLHDSKLVSYPISGDLAFRYAWGDPSVFALAVGGFNPHYQPPAGFPTLKRLAITISSSVAHLEAKGYLALTSNTLQFGASVELTAGAGGLQVHGFLGFDALLEWDPLAFEFDLAASVDLKAGSTTLASVHLSGQLSGPSPWHIAGQASISLLFFDLSVSFDKTWGSAVAAAPPPDPLPAVTAALAQPSGWSSVLPPAVRAVVTAAEAPTDAAGAILLDPAGDLRIAQRAAPLGQAITRFGGVPLSRTLQLSIDALSVLGTAVSQPATATEEFAPAQFLDLPDADKLSLPSFSRFSAGVEVGGAVDLGTGPRTRAVLTGLTYDTTVLDTQPAPKQVTHYVPTGLALLAMNDSAQRAQPGGRRYAPAPGTRPLVTLAPDRWVVAGTAALDPTAGVAGDGTKLGTLLALREHLAANPAQVGQLQVVLAGEAT
jgi:hypothetical protein